jgi:hypothetical protein
MKAYVGFLALVFLGLQSLGQSPTPPVSAGLESGRYQKPGPGVPTALPAKKVKSVPPKEVQLIPPVVRLLPTEKKVAPPAELPLIEKKAAPEVRAVESKEAAQLSPAILAVGSEEAEPGQPGVSQVETESNPEQEPSVIEQVKSLVRGEVNPEVQLYREQVHPDDQRLNRVELEFFSGIENQNAQSNSAYRSYATTNPVMGYRVGFWLTPFVGIEGNLQQVMAGGIPSAADSNKRVAILEDQTRVGILGRKFFGYSRKSNYLTWGFQYWTDNLRVPSDETSRVSLKSTAWGFSALVSLPTAPSYTWNFGGSIYPRLQHSESASSLNLRSGGGPEASRVEMLVGGDFRLSRSNALGWSLSVAAEREQYSGSSSVAEPDGSTASSVSVMKTSTFVRLGYKFGL